jgi:hypothetical protein
MASPYSRMAQYIQQNVLSQRNDIDIPPLSQEAVKELLDLLYACFKTAATPIPLSKVRDTMSLKSTPSQQSTPSLTRTAQLLLDTLKSTEKKAPTPPTSLFNTNVNTGIATSNIPSSNVPSLNIKAPTTGTVASTISNSTGIATIKPLETLPMYQFEEPIGFMAQFHGNQANASTLPTYSFD